MTDVLAKPYPPDVRQKAADLALLMTGREVTEYVIREVISAAIMGERRRCANIVDAECEWGGDIRECERKINSGEGPRRIPGYNSPSED